MKKITFTIIFMVLIIPLFLVNVHGQTLQVDANLGDMREIEESKYKATGISVLRNSNGELISVVRVDASRYLDDPIIDVYLKSDPENLVKEGSINGKKVSMYRVVANYSYTECLDEIDYDVPGYNKLCNWYHRATTTFLGVTDEAFNYNIFRGLNHAFTVQQGDQVTTFWNILTRD